MLSKVWQAVGVVRALPASARWPFVKRVFRQSAVAMGAAFVTTVTYVRSTAEESEVVWTDFASVWALWDTLRMDDAFVHGLWSALGLAVTVLVGNVLAAAGRGSRSRVRQRRDDKVARAAEAVAAGDADLVEVEGGVVDLSSSQARRRLGNGGIG